MSYLLPASRVTIWQRPRVSHLSQLAHESQREHS